MAFFVFGNYKQNDVFSELLGKKYESEYLINNFRKIRQSRKRSQFLLNSVALEIN